MGSKLDSQSAETVRVRPPTTSRPKIIYLVTEDWYFWSHRLPMARAARNAGFEVCVATKVTEHRDLIEAEGFIVYPLSWHRRRGGLGNLLTILQIASLYRRDRPDIVHHVALKPVLFGALAARFAGRPAIVSALTGLGYAFAARSFRARLLRSLVSLGLRVLVNRSQSIVVLQNPDDQSLLKERRVVAPTRTRLIRGSGIDTRHFQPMPEPPDKPLICALVSRMLTIKGVPAAVEAVQVVRRRGIDLQLHLAGTPDPDSPATIRQEQLESWSSEAGIKWLGYVTDVREVWRSAHIALLPSLGGEGIPKSLLEAAACARPIVASDVPGCREIVLAGVNGELVPPGDVQALANALEALSHDHQRRRRYGAESRRLVEADLSADAVGQSVVAIYKELLADTKGASNILGTGPAA